MPATDEQLEFLRTSRLLIMGIGRGERAPHMSPVYYVLDGADIVISTMASRYKAKAVRRGAPVSLCVIGEQPPFPYLMIEGDARIVDEGAAEAMMKIGERMTGNPIPDAAKPVIEKRAQDEGRVVLRVTPTRYRSTMPLSQKKD